MIISKAATRGVLETLGVLGHQRCSRVFTRDFQACNFIKKRLQHRCFSVNIEKVLRTPISKNICERLLLSFQRYYHDPLCRDFGITPRIKGNFPFNGNITTCTEGTTNNLVSLKKSYEIMKTNTKKWQNKIQNLYI